MVAVHVVQDEGPRDRRISGPSREEIISRDADANGTPQGTYSNVIAVLTCIQERGDATSSFVADFLSGRETTAEEQKLCQEVATSFYGGAYSAILEVHMRADQMCSGCGYGMRTYGVMTTRLTFYRRSPPCFPSS